MRELLLALTIGLAVSASVARRAAAYLLTDGDVVWTFEGHGGPPGGDTNQPVSGSLRFSYSTTAGGTALLDLTVGGVPNAARGATDTQVLQVGDGSGAPSSADYVYVPYTYTYLNAPSLLHPYDGVNWGYGYWQLLLRDTDGTAWTGLTGPLPPADPPDASVFETRDIQLLQQYCEDFGTGVCPGSFQPPPAILYDFTIDAFTVPEPSALGACALALATLLTCRRRLSSGETAA
jgi:hypothetical protein